MSRSLPLISILVPLLFVGCSGKRREDPILQLSAAEALEIDVAIIRAAAREDLDTALAAIHIVERNVLIFKFVVIGLGEEVIERCFSGTPSQVGGIGFQELADEAVARHAAQREI